jgi:hypothetical protein
MVSIFLVCLSVQINAILKTLDLYNSAYDLQDLIRAIRHDMYFNREHFHSFVYHTMAVQMKATSTPVSNMIRRRLILAIISSWG